MAETQAAERLSARVHALRARKAQLDAQQRDTEKDDEIRRLREQVDQARTELADMQAHRLGEFARDDYDDHGRMSGAGSKLKGTPVRTVHRFVSDDPEVREVHRHLDTLYVLRHAITDDTGRPVPVTESRYFQNLVRTHPYFREQYKAGIGAGSGESMNVWVPDGWSASLHRRVELGRRLGALHRRMPMTEPVMYLPFQGLRGRSYIVPERSGANDYTDAAKAVPATFDSTSPTGPTDPGVGRLRLEAAKVGHRIVVSEETREDSIIAAMPYFEDELVSTLLYAEEDAQVNGDVAAGSGTALDADRVAAAWAKDHIAAFNGYRKIIRGQTSPARAACVTAKVITEADIMALKILAGKYAMGLANQTSVLVTSALGYNRMLTMKDDQGNQLVTTLDKIGPQATVITGQMGSVFGLPIIPSDVVREDLDVNGTAAGVTATDRTAVYLVNRDQFLFGDYRLPRIKGRDIIETDQVAMVVMRRFTFNGFNKTEHTLAELYNV